MSGHSPVLTRYICNPLEGCGILLPFCFVLQHVLIILIVVYQIIFSIFSPFHNIIRVKITTLLFKRLFTIFQNSHIFQTKYSKIFKTFQVFNCPIYFKIISLNILCASFKYLYLLVHLNQPEVLI